MRPSTKLALLELFVAAAARSQLQISGVGAPEDAINGVYRPMAEMINGAVTYKQDGVDHWLVRDPHGFWNVQPGSKKATADGFMIGSHGNLEGPELEDSWQLWRSGEWTVMPQVRVFSPGLRTASSSEVSSVWKWAIASLVLGGLVVLLAGMYVSHHSQPLVRSYLYNTISHTVAGTAGILLAQAIIICLGDNVRDLGVASAVLFPASFATDILSVGFLTIPVLVPLIYFIVLFIAITPLGWKFQFSHARLLALAMLQASLTGFLGFYAFSAMQNQFQVGLLWRSLITLVVAAAVLAILMLATRNLCVRRMAEPPKEPWPAPASGTAQALDWGRYVAHAEAEVGSLIVAFLLYALVFGAWADSHSTLVTVIQAIVFVVLLAVLFIDGLERRAGYLVEHLIKGAAARFLGLCVVGVSAWYLHSSVELPAYFAMAILTLGLTFLGLLAIWLFGVVSHGERHLHKAGHGALHVRAPPGQTQPLASWACAGLGLMMAVPWAELLSVSLGVAVGGTTYWEDHRILLKVLLSVVLVVCISFCWRFYIAPRADADDLLHREALAQEHDHFVRAGHSSPTA